MRFGFLFWLTKIMLFFFRLIRVIAIFIDIFFEDAFEILLDIDSHSVYFCRRMIVGQRILPNEAHVWFEFLYRGVLPFAYFFFNSSDIHWLFDYVIVIWDIELYDIDGMEKRDGTRMPLNLSENTVNFFVDFIVPPYRYFCFQVRLPLGAGCPWLFFIILVTYTRCIKIASWPRLAFLGSLISWYDH